MGASINFFSHLSPCSTPRQSFLMIRGEKRPKARHQGRSEIGWKKDELKKKFKNIVFSFVNPENLFFFVYIFLIVMFFIDGV